MKEFFKTPSAIFILIAIAIALLASLIHTDKTPLVTPLPTDIIKLDGK